LIKPILDSNKKWNYESEKHMEKAFAELLQKAIAAIPRTISSSQLEKLDQDEILEAFYEEMIEGAMGIFAEHEVVKGDKIEKARIIENKLREWCEKTLITSTGERAAIQRGNESSAGMINSVVDFLEDNYMLRGKSSSNGKWYELAHDKLVEVVQKSNKALKERQEIEKITSKNTAKYIDFYARVIRKVSKEVRIGEAELRNWCETKLITPNGTRAILIQEAEMTGGLRNSIVDKLENAHFIIARRRLGTKWYELTYDKLIGAIKTSNREWKFERDKRKRKKIILAGILPAIFGSVVILISALFLNISAISHEPCSGQNMIDTLRANGPPVDIAVDPKTSLAYAAYADSNAIQAISCNRAKLTVTPISIDGQVKKLDVDPTSNKIYASTTDTNSPLVIDSNNDLDSSIINETYSEYRNGSFNDILYDSPEFGIPQEAKVIPSTIDLNTNGTLNSIKTGKIYVADNSDGIIHVKSSEGDLLKDITGLGTSPLPFSLIENPNTNKIYVINPALSKVSVIDSKTDKLRNIPVGTGPIDITIDEIDNKIYVANQGSGTISVIDGKEDQVVQVIPIAQGSSNRLQSIAVDSKTHLLYLGFWYSDGTGSVSIVNPAVYNVDKYIQVSQSPIDIDFDTNTSKLYIAEFNNRSVAVIDTNTDNVTKDISLGESKSNNFPLDIAVNPNSNKIYVVNINSGNNDSNSIVSVITGKNDSILKNISLPFLVSDIAIDSSSNKVYVVGSDKNQSYLSVIDGHSDTVMNSKSFPFVPSDIAVNSNTGNIYLANNKNWSITMIDSKGDNKTIPLSIPPESIVIDPTINRIYVTSYSKPSLSKQQSFLDPKDITLPRLTQMQIIDGSNNSVWWNNQPLKLGPRYGDMILSFNPETHDLVATSPSTNTIQSWNLNQAKNAIERLDGNLHSVKQLSAGIDYAQLAMNNNGSKLYIVNPLLNAIKVENVSSSIIGR
jgi:YVTN family beta-propeller protein